MKRAALIGGIMVALLVGGAQAAGELTLTVVSETNSTVTLGWQPQPGYGYLFSADGQLVSRTNDPSRSSVKFSKQYSTYEVAVIVKGATGVYPPPVPKAACANGLDDDGDGKIDYPSDPGCSSATDTSEADPVPPPVACGDGIDNDSDGKTDYPADPGCTSLADTDETDPVVPPPSGQALWVDVNGGSCTRVVNGPYVDAQACGSFSAALSAAQPGDMITVRGGTYGPQTLSQNKAGARIVFQAASGETVKVQTTWGQNSLTITTSGGNLTFRRIDVSWLAGGSCSGESRDVTFEGSKIQTFLLQRAVNWSFIGGEVGPAQTTNAADAHPLLDDCGVTTVNKNVLFDGVYFHDVYTTTGAHTECLLVVGVDGLVVRNSRFFNCDSTGDIYITRWNFGTASDHGIVENVLIENNFFMDDTGYSGGPAGSSGSQPWSIQLENDASIVFRNNTVTKSLLLLDSRQSCGGCGDPIRPVTIANNYASTGGCLAGVTYVGNVWKTNTAGANSTGCGTPLRSGSVQVVDRRTDLHLLPGADAINQASAVNAPATDIDGQSRPLGSSPDAGADERE